MLTAKDAVQREKDELLREIRHLSSLCTCPSFIGIEDLQEIIYTLIGEGRMFTTSFENIPTFTAEGRKRLEDYARKP